MEKDLIRKVYMEKRASISKQAFQNTSEQIIESAIKLIEKVKPKMVHCFLPIESKLEFNTQPLINYCWVNKIDVVVPISDFNSSTMKSALYHSNTILEINKYNIPEPVNPQWVDETEIDLVITPLLAFDTLGYRVGYGKGFYDRFFQSINPEVKKVGISLFDPIDQIGNSNSFDIKLDYCITPKTVFSF